MTVEISWVPGHTSVQGNKKTIETAKNAAESNSVRRLPERFTSLAYIGYIVTDWEWKETKHKFQKQQEGRSHIQQARYNPAMKIQGPDEAAIRG